MFDLLIKNGFVIDGSGQNRTKSDIGITGEKISFIGDSKGKESKESINVDGMIVSPGFIDTHTQTQRHTHNL
jgi:N-acyl-D-aspartate/D-glutamate deacylase